MHKRGEGENGGSKAAAQVKKRRVHPQHKLIGKPKKKEKGGQGLSQEKSLKKKEKFMSKERKKGREEKRDTWTVGTLQNRDALGGLQTQKT